MAGNRPDAVELLAAVQSQLASLTDSGKGSQRYPLRMAIKALEIVARELGDGANAAASEREAFAALLDQEGDLETLRRALCDALRTRRLQPDDPAVLAVLRVAAMAHVAIDNPALLAQQAPAQSDNSAD